MLQRIVNGVLLRPFRARCIGRRLANIGAELGEELIKVLLRGIRLALLLDPDFRKGLKTFKGRYLFKSRESEIEVEAVFDRGRVTWSERPKGRHHATLVFKNPGVLWHLLLSGRPDLLGAMLQQDVTFDGNLNYLYRFAYMANHLRLQFVKSG
jgi:hypothetical protein